MAKKKTLKPHNTKEELQRVIKSTRDGQYRLRVQTILRVMEGASTQDIVEQMMITKETMFRWMKWYNDNGLSALENVNKGGRQEGNPKWDQSIFMALFRKLDKMEEFFSVPKMREWIKKEYHVSIPEQTIHYQLKKGGYSFKSNRPNPYKGDPKLQAAFKKVVS